MNPERWIKYYSSSHNILLVGEGDFSFSLCLGMSFGCATNIVATTLDSYDGLINKYKYAKANVATLRVLGASVLHGVDATQMSTLPDLRCKKFHRIIYNFPHAGFYGKEDNPILIMMHRNLVRGFLQNASSMLCEDGEIHVNHKTKTPFDRWRIEDLGSECSLVCIAQDDFRIQDYPGYNNKRGSSSRADEPFPLGACKTYRFRLQHPSTLINPMMIELELVPPPSQMFVTPTTTFTYPMFPPPPVVQYGPLPVYDDGVALHSYASECYMIFERYLNHVDETFGDTSYDVGSSVKEALSLGYEMYMSNAAPGRPSSGFISILEELHRLSVFRSERLRQMLFLS
ncbi:hypothetical protein C2S51_029414 [Perilla frutescens var. frutescens]|nr:hypothetical protein C2S51_029414 [Perilla frutescens var. frutescens]